MTASLPIQCEKRVREGGSGREHWHISQDVCVAQEIPASCLECRELLLRYLTRYMCSLFQDLSQWQLISHLTPLFRRQMKSTEYINQTML